MLTNLGRALAGVLSTAVGILWMQWEFAVAPSVYDRRPYAVYPLVQILEQSRMGITVKVRAENGTVETLVFRSAWYRFYRPNVTVEYLVDGAARIEVYRGYRQWWIFSDNGTVFFRIAVYNETEARWQSLYEEPP
ncbi:MAG: hypothetical protein HYS74_00990 [Parcubacteria group bacterium]|nr:hypothetical protein [Parcubacteria group bacterium]